jgi:hypothetical protein
MIKRVGLTVVLALIASGHVLAAPDQVTVQGAAPQSRVAQAIRNCGIPPSDIAPPCNLGGVNVFHDPGCGPTNCAAHFHGECTPFACLPGNARLRRAGSVREVLQKPLRRMVMVCG